MSLTQIHLTNKQARQLLLLKQGLIGDYSFTGKQGIYDFIKQAGCIQFDPIDICGKNPEIVLHSRVKGLKKELIYDLLYNDRKLIDYFDKNMAIFCIEDWKYFSRRREHFIDNIRSREQINKIADEIKEIIQLKGYVSSKDIDSKEKVDWYWSETSISRAALETLYFRGDLIIHHKKGTIKNYALAKEHIPEEILSAKDPNKSFEEYLEWNILRRIESVGLLWNKASDAWLYIDGLKAANRNDIFKKLLKEEKLIEIFVEGIIEPLYCLSKDKNLIEIVLSNKTLHGRIEFIAPLDNMMWDRKLIEKLFGFSYKWEIYTPASKRKYGYYVLPILSGDEFIGRIEIVNDRKVNQLIIKNIWFEENVVIYEDMKTKIEQCIYRFSLFNDCNSIYYEKNIVEQ